MEIVVGVVLELEHKYTRGKGRVLVIVRNDRRHLTAMNHDVGLHNFEPSPSARVEPSEWRLAMRSRKP